MNLGECTGPSVLWNTLGPTPQGFLLCSRTHSLCMLECTFLVL